jgi:hypothetical protein
MGLAIGPNAIVGKYTYFGDVNIDGQVTGDDYTVIDANLNTSPPEVWDGSAVTPTSTAPSPATITRDRREPRRGRWIAACSFADHFAVPEPAAASVLALAAAMLSPAATIENPPAENISVAPRRISPILRSRTSKRI